MSKHKAPSHAGEGIVVPRQLFKNDQGQETLTMIFACLEERKPFPENLQISVIPGVPDGVKLTPPQYEFPEGLYVLLPPWQKSKGETIPQVPPHLLHFVTEQAREWSQCIWTLCGPMNSSPSRFQKRKAYPTKSTDPSYSNAHAASLWTICNPQTGREAVGLRLLHVYAKRATKRAAKKQIALPSTTTAGTAAAPPSPASSTVTGDRPQSAMEKVKSRFGNEQTASCIQNDGQPGTGLSEPMVLEDYSAEDIAKLVAAKGIKFQSFADKLREADIHGKLFANLLYQKGLEGLDSLCDDAGFDNKLMRRSFYTDLMFIPRLGNFKPSIHEV